MDVSTTGALTAGVTELTFAGSESTTGVVILVTVPTNAESLGRVESVSAGFLEKLVRNGEIALLQQPKERVLFPFGSIEASVAFGPRPLFLRLRR